MIYAFMRYPWPGNVRELEHSIEHAFVLCHGDRITFDHIPSEIKEYSVFRNRANRKDQPEGTQGVLHALEETAWNKAKAARLLGISRQTLYRKIKEKKLSEPIE